MFPLVSCLVSITMIMNENFEFFYQRKKVIRTIINRKNKCFCSFLISVGTSFIPCFDHLTLILLN